MIPEGLGSSVLTAVPSSGWLVGCLFNSKNGRGKSELASEFPTAWRLEGMNEPAQVRLWHHLVAREVPAVESGAWL